MKGRIRKNIKKHFVKIGKKGLPIVVSTMMFLPSNNEGSVHMDLNNAKSAYKSETIVSQTYIPFEGDEIKNISSATDTL